MADTTRKVVLRWPNKEDTMTTGIRPDAIVSTLVQRAFGQSLGFGEVKLGADSTTNHSLCMDTVKLTVLSRNSVFKCGHPILTFQVNGFQLVFYMTQMIHANFFTMTEIGCITLPEILSCLYSFVTLKNIRTLLRVTLYFGIAVTKQIHHHLSLHLSARHPPHPPKLHIQSTPQHFLPL
ncbi:uncharacterized protein EV154DRAFT_290329 [Mucor mucedo]|uniref:uncharacterized protein n=1 Tax=Mucor mucedo TaxID=29922 RepID=UPI00221ECEDA|nr:uncharacterized protein EV154DRAFT_290329 [Mucor mucedo]KAI7889049.1 hypothetical protein EV154DRAFT_290329 [Mucor mucedo]